MLTTPQPVSGSSKHSPAAAAKEALRILLSARLQPTPENYRKAYYQACGEPPPEVPTAGASAAPRSISLADDETALTSKLHWMLIRAMKLGIQPNLPTNSSLRGDMADLVGRVESARDLAGLEQTSADFSSALYKLSALADDSQERLTSLEKIAGLALANLVESHDDEQPLAREIQAITISFAESKDTHSLQTIERQLKDVLLRQGVVKKGFEDTKDAMRALMATFVERLKSMVTSTGDYETRLNEYATRIRQTSDISDLGKLIDSIISDTSGVQVTIANSRQEMLAAQTRVQEAEQRIQELEVQVSKLGDLTRADPLTGILNRRGMDDAFQKSISLAARQKLPLCVALLDIDNFKKLNDTYGHKAGDQALTLVATTISSSLRASDSVARIGGEEFAILMPATPLDAAADVVRRLQRNLTNAIFLYENQQLFVTFSAGVVLWIDGEQPNAVLERADRALYRAKRAGKNRVEVEA
jgi:diguanylate cyclase